MEDTCKADKCKLHDLLGGDVEQCPSFVLSGWRDEKGEFKNVRDCAPIRTMLMIQHLMNQTLGLQQAQEQQRNKTDVVLNIVNRAIKASALINDDDKRMIS